MHASNLPWVAIVAATIGWGCRVPPSAQTTSQAAPVPAEGEAVAQQEESTPTLEELRDECIRSFLSNVGLSTAELEAEVDPESEESVRRSQQLEMQIEALRGLCETQAIDKQARAVCVQRVAPEHARGCELYPRTHELPVDLRAAPTAIVEIGELVRAYWMVEHQHPDWSGQHGCPPAGSGSGDTGFVPPLSADCSASPSGQCVAVDQPSQPWEFASDRLGPGTAWHEMGFRPAMDRLRFHYRFQWNNESSSDGCTFQIEVRPTGSREDASGSFTMEYAIDRNGMNGAERFQPGTSIDDE